MEHRGRTYWGAPIGGVQSQISVSQNTQLKETTSTKGLKCLSTTKETKTTISKPQKRKEAAMPKQSKIIRKSSAFVRVLKSVLSLVLVVNNALVSPGDSSIAVQPNTP